MKNQAARRQTCRLCGGKNLELVLKLAVTPIGDAYIPKERINETQPCFPIELFLCNSCGLSQLLNVIDPESVYSKYIYHTSDSLGLVEHFRKYAVEIISFANPPAGSLVIDIGSNDGSLLRFFKDKGMRVLGIDPAITIAQQATKSGIKTLQKFFDYKVAQEIKRKYGQAYIITANNAIANIDDLSGMIGGIRDLLEPDGIFVFETGYFLDLLTKRIFDNIYHEHISYFTVNTLNKLFNSHDMKLLDVTRIPTKGGSIRGIAQLSGGSRKVSSSVQELIELESKHKMHNSETIKAFSNSLLDIKKELLKILNDLKSKGKKIAGYGASVGVTTVLYYFNLDHTLLDFIVDDNPQRQNLYSPGFHIPVLHPEEICDRKIDFVIILAWQYAGPIIKKHQSYLDQGGQFITFLPKLEIIGNHNIKKS